MDKSVKFFAGYFAAALIFIFSACSGDKSTRFESAEELVAHAKASVRSISVAEFQKVMNSDSPYYLIDVREDDEFAVACIPGALSIPRGILENVISEMAPGKRVPVYLYCSNGDRSSLAAMQLPAFKYASVKVIEGGFEHWQEVNPENIEQSPVRGEVKKVVAKPAAGCGG